MEVRNEFAVVEVSVQERGGSTALVIENATEDASIALDALELEALTRTTHERFRQLISAAPPYAD
jgi:hypothetical protein